MFVGTQEPSHHLSPLAQGPDHVQFPHPPRLTRTIVFGIYVALTLILLFAPIGSGLPSGYFDWFDKVVHFFLFMGIAGLGYWTVPSVGLAAAIGVGLAGGTELLQGPLTYRSTEFWDFLAGGLGAVAGAWAAMVLKRFLRGSSVDGDR
jgi:VanZ family protein